MKMQDYIPEKPLLPWQPWRFQVHGVTFSLFYKTHTPTRAGFLLSEAEDVCFVMNAHSLTQVMISSAPATAETMDKAEYLRLDCTIKEVQFTAGQKQDIDVTTLCSTEQEKHQRSGGVVRDFHVG